jgi:glycosyltransferase involved in cell wall biosynthesis
VVTGNGVNLDRFFNTKEQSLLYDVVFFGRIAFEKGLSTLLEAWKFVVAELPHAKLLFMGGFSGNQKKELLRVVERLGIGSNVECTGFVTDQEVVHMLNSSRLFVFPSTDEGFGLTVLEAMASGLPCVLSDLPAFRENFGSVAVFAEVGNARNLAKQILDLLSDPKRCIELGKRGQTFAKNFSWERVAKREMKVFEDLLDTSQT